MTHDNAYSHFGTYFFTVRLQKSYADGHVSVFKNKAFGVIPYTTHGAQISPPLFLFLFIFCFYAYFRLGLLRRDRLRAPQG